MQKRGLLTESVVITGVQAKRIEPLVARNIIIFQIRDFAEFVRVFVKFPCLIYGPDLGKEYHDDGRDKEAELVEHVSFLIVVDRCS